MKSSNRTISLAKSNRAEGSTETSQRTLRTGGVRGMVDHANGFFTSIRTWYQSAAQSKKLRLPMDVGPNGANGEIPTIRARSRYAKANYGWYRQSMRQLAANVVGYGISPVIKYPDLKKLYKLWGTEADARGKLDINGIQWMMMDMVGTDGEGIARFRDRLEADMLSGVPFQIQLMPADHLPIGWTKPGENGNWIVDGIERNQIERAIQYWLYPRNPLDWRGNGGNSFEPQPVPAAHICHVFWPETVQSERGVPWGAAILNSLEFLRDYQQSEIQKKALQSKFTVVYSKPSGADEEGAGYSGPEDEGEPEFSALPAGAAVEAPEGYEPTLVDMPATDSNYEMFNRFSIAEVAVAIGLCVEQITMDWSKVNDRVYRAMMLEVGRFVISIQYHMMIAQFLNPMWKRFVASAIASKRWVPPEGAHPADYFMVEWMPPARGHIHPVQEVQAFMMAVQAGFTSRSKVAAEFGWDIDEIDLENAADSQRSQIEGLAYSVYEGWKDQPLTPEMSALRLQQQKAVKEAILKMAVEDMDLGAVG